MEKMQYPSYIDIYDLILWYLRESGGDPWIFREDLSCGVPINEAFFWGLNLEDRVKLIDAGLDPREVPASAGRAGNYIAVSFALDYLTK